MGGERAIDLEALQGQFLLKRLGTERARSSAESINLGAVNVITGIIGSLNL